MDQNSTNADYTVRHSCRLCGGELRDALDLGAIYVSTFVDTADTTAPRIPITLCECIKCGVIQLRHTVTGDVMYREYWYQSGLNKFMVDALANVVESTLARVQLETTDVLVDIGSNDGTLFDQYSEWVHRNCWLVGYEPSNLAKLSHNKAHYIINDYFNATAYLKKFPKKAKVITSIAMFYDLDEPHKFVDQVKSILHEEGVWTIQLMDLLSMIRTNDFPNLCHEHLIYYKLADIAVLMAQHGLRVFDVEYNNVNGSSLRVYVCHDASARENAQLYYTALTDEFDFFQQLGNVAEYFKQSVESVRAGVVSFIRYQRDNGKTISVLGASTKGNTILQYFELGPDDIINAAEINPDKYGKLTIGTNIPIIPESECLAQNPDYLFILPCGFLPMFLRKFDEYMNQGGALLVPLPAPAVYYKKDGKLHVWEI